MLLFGLWLLTWKGVRDYIDVFVKGTGNQDENITIMTKYIPLKYP